MNVEVFIMSSALLNMNILDTYQQLDGLRKTQFSSIIFIGRI